MNREGNINGWANAQTIIFPEASVASPQNKGLSSFGLASLIRKRW